ncbi:MAG: DUF3455 domain-containing protein [Vitreoscilla sp.]|nr:DUF3455 domain-containing protein [Polaromonas sp.]
MKSTHNTARAYGKSALSTLAIITGTAVMMAACSSVKPPAREYSQDNLVEAIRVPAGNEVVLETTGVGVLNYECRANVAATGTIGWALASPKADLIDRTGKTVGSYGGPPATWTHMDGSTVVGTQVVLSPVMGSNNIALQLSKGTPGMGAGVLQNVSYIQRINTKGGQDISMPCTQTEIGKKITLPYQADYIFWKAV